LARLLPLYWITLLAGIFIVPRLSSGGWWFMLEQGLFYQCDKYWWANMLLIGNFVPWE